MKKIVIGFLGKARAGKDTSAEYMIEHLKKNGINMIHESFAALLKEQVAKDCFWDGEKDEYGRKLLQDFSKPIKAYTSHLHEKYPDNELFADMADGAYYPALTLKRIRESAENVFVITDFRFQSETRLFSSKDDVEFITIRIIRRNEDGSLFKGDLSAEALADISENDLNDYQTTYTIENVDDLIGLKKKTEKITDEIFKNSSLNEEKEFKDAIEDYLNDDVTIVECLDLGNIKQVIEVSDDRYDGPYLNHYEGNSFKEIFKECFASPLFDNIDFGYDEIVMSYPVVAKELEEMFKDIKPIKPEVKDILEYLRYVNEFNGEKKNKGIKPLCMSEYFDEKAAE